MPSVFRKGKVQISDVPHKKPLAWLAAVLVLSALSVFAGGCASPKGNEMDMGGAPMEGISERWGIEVVGIRLSATGYMLDFRYRVIDPDKAAPLFDHRLNPVLTDQGSGAKFLVPSSPKVGALRTTDRSGPPMAGRTYFIFFANPGRYIKAGARVAVEIGDFRAEDLVVE